MSEVESDLRAVIAKGVLMREAQKRYFRTRQGSDLNASKKLEAEYDAACRRVTGQAGPDLFSGEKS